MSKQVSSTGTKDEALLKRIRQRYRYGLDKWRRNREDGQKNMKYVAGDPWDEADKQAREGRPTVCPDEINQYVNQVVNTARQNPRGVKVDPAGDGATNALANYRENRIRAIEYACNASQAYVNALQAAVERNLGFVKVSRAYVSDKSDEQEIFVLPVMNPDSIVIDPDFKELDASDARWAFEVKSIPIEDFEEQFPKADKASFRAEDFGDDAKYWLDEKSILICIYWEVRSEDKPVEGSKKNRVAKKRMVSQYVTNGIEILKTGAVQPGPYIPIVPVGGKEIWVDYGSGAERVLVSLVTLARDPQKALAYVMSSMLEQTGQIPKGYWVGAKGQFESDEEAWKDGNSVYRPYKQYDPMVDAGGQTPVAPPQFHQEMPQFQAYSTGTDICRRAIQSAMGINALPTAAQRQNQKSGVALEKIQSEQSIGSYHLVDNYDRAIKLVGRIINHWLSEVDLGEVEKPVRAADGKHQLVKINTDAPVTIDGSTYHFPIADDEGRYQITISSGPSHESQREEGSEFLSQMMQNLQQLPAPGSPAAKILALGIRMKQLGPLGDQMADILDPPNQGGQQQQQMAQLQQQGQALSAQVAKMQGIVQELLLEKQGKVIEMQAKTAR